MASEPRYRVTVKQAFQAWSILFLPGQEYVVKKRVYDSLVDDKPFKDLCATAESITR